MSGAAPKQRRKFDAAAGEARKLAALAGHEVRYASEIRAARRALLRVLFERGTATVDDVWAVLGEAKQRRPTWMGAAVRGLRVLRIIRHAGYVETARAVAHSRPVTSWELADRGAAERWLREHPDRSHALDVGTVATTGPPVAGNATGPAAVTAEPAQKAPGGPKLSTAELFPF
jgi:hypothetical protein